MSDINQEVVVDHVSNLSSSKKPILFMSFLFLQTDLFLEVGIPNDLVQGRCNPRVQHLKIRETSISLNRARCFFLNRRPSPLLGSKTLPPRENRNKNLLGFWILYSNMKTLKVWRIYRNEAPRIAVFANQPSNSVVFPLERKNSWLTAYWQNLALELCFPVVLHISRQVSLYSSARGFHLWHFDS